MHVEGFDNLDQAFLTMSVMEDIGNLDLTTGQIALRDDVANIRYWAQPVPEWDLVIYGVTHPVAETQAGAGFDVAENRKRGYLTGLAFSKDLPSGESGDTHVSQVVPIDRETYTLAMSLGWPGWSDMMSTEETRALGRALAEWEQAAR